MRRLGRMGFVAALLVGTSLAAASAPAGAATKPTKPMAPGEPAAVIAVSANGTHGVTVAWAPPLSDGGSPILFYWVSTYNGKHFCHAAMPGPDTCVIPGIAGQGHYSIGVRAFNASAHGPTARTTNIVTQPASSSKTSPGSPATGAAPTTAAGSTPLSSSGGTGTGTAAGETGTSGAVTTSANDPSVLPFTGANVQTLLLIGLGLVLAGLLMMSSARRQRRALRGLERWFLGE